MTESCGPVYHVNVKGDLQDLNVHEMLQCVQKTVNQYFTQLMLHPCPLRAITLSNQMHRCHTYTAAFTTTSSSQ